jgi:hypothetical protein
VRQGIALSGDDDSGLAGIGYDGTGNTGRFSDLEADDIQVCLQFAAKLSDVKSLARTTGCGSLLTLGYLASLPCNFKVSVTMCCSARPAFRQYYGRYGTQSPATRGSADFDYERR